MFSFMSSWKCIYLKLLILFFNIITALLSDHPIEIDDKKEINPLDLVYLFNEYLTIKG